MIKVLKQTPATINGRDCYETLVHDDCKDYDCVCNNCCYRDWRDYQETETDCSTVHGCTLDPDTYFIAEQI